MDHEPITLYITGDLSCFRYFWGVYVVGFRPDVHCQKCLIGKRSIQLGPDAPTDEPIYMDEATSPYLYLCGYHGHWPRNLHAALRVSPGRTELIRAFNGATIRAQNAERLPIPPLPPNYRGLDESFTTCRNYQFGAAYFGENRCPA